ncbi:hypothetical protein [Leucobacter sp. PH1c]|uniref:hypothetical protein n=1 Tax=Leucobacter sp. PH1c TaxID=1397278 RepID=UPI0012FEBFCC|nr:hypothetical protein [Leucobacter sp. PH1c]
MIFAANEKKLIPVVMLALVLSGCADGEYTAPDGPRSITGPWAQEIASLLRDYPSSFAREVFADSKVTEQELSEAINLVEDCFTLHNLEVTWDKYGRETVTGETLSSDQPPDILGECAFSDGGVMVMYYRMRLNPEKVDDMELWAACLVQEGVVEPGFTKHDLLGQFDAGSKPWDDNDPRGPGCMTDPLGLMP